MTCEQAQQMFGLVWDLPEGDSERAAFEAHLAECSRCAEQFRLWEESESMLRRLRLAEAGNEADDRINRNVMDRIYAEHSWLMPVKDRTYRWSQSMRRSIAGAMACCLAMFVCSFFYLVLGKPERGASKEQVEKLTGLIDTTSAVDGFAPISIEFYQDVPVASISDPILLNVVPTYPHYWIALSILGMIMTLLTINWLARTQQ